MRVRFAVLAPVLWLAACGGGEPVAPEGGETAATPPVAEADPMEAAPEGVATSSVYRCTDFSQVPVGVLTVQPSGDYSFQVVKGDAYAPVDGDPGTGSGAFAVDGVAYTPTSGPFKDFYKMTGTREPFDNARGQGFSLQFASDDGAMALLCWPHT